MSTRFNRRGRNQRSAGHWARVGGAYARQQMQQSQAPNPEPETRNFRFKGTVPVAAAACPHCGEVLISEGQSIHDPLNCAMNPNPLRK